MTTRGDFRQAIAWVVKDHSKISDDPSHPGYVVEKKGEWPTIIISEFHAAKDGSSALVERKMLFNLGEGAH